MNETRRFPMGWAILILTVLSGFWAYNFYAKAELNRLHDVAVVRKAPSRLYANLLIRYDRPPLFEEEYKMQDVEGVSGFTYRVRGYNGHQVTVTAPPAAVYDVSFFFQHLDQIGIWQLMNKDPRPDADAHYSVYVKQFADFKQGDRTVTFTDPKYWATTAGRQFHIDLSKQNPNDLLKLESTAMADPRYEEIVDAFRTFGPPEFRANITRAQAQVEAAR